MVKPAVIGLLLGGSIGPSPGATSVPPEPTSGFAAVSGGLPASGSAEPPPEPPVLPPVPPDWPPEPADAPPEPAEPPEPPLSSGPPAWPPDPEPCEPGLDEHAATRSKAAADRRIMERTYISDKSPSASLKEVICRPERHRHAPGIRHQRPGQAVINARGEARTMKTT